jgi:sugar lactone lactonase YvrE
VPSGVAASLRSLAPKEKLMSRTGVVLALTLMCVAGGGKADAVNGRSGRLTVERIVTGLEGGSGSVVGPGGALYVTEAHAGRISRVDPRTGRVTTFASGLPTRMPGFGFGGVIDVAFIGRTAYALVTLVGPDVGGSDTVGIYRVDGPHRSTVVVDIGEFSLQNPPTIPFEFFVPTGAQYALENYRGGFVVTDGHLNRVLRVKHDGTITEMRAFGNIVPTGLTIAGNTVFTAFAGPVPHVPENGRIASFTRRSPTVTPIASGAPLLVDVEFGSGQDLYALSQGVFPVGEPEGSPALPNTGALVRVRRDGTFRVVVDRLNQPTSLEFIGDTAYVVTYGGEIWRIEGVSGGH